MAQNKNALIRYRTIDKCLQNRYRTWTLEDLIIACSDALNEFEGREVNVSKRTVQLDIQLMRSDKLGYNAPIITYQKKYYKYDDEHYSITNIPVTENDIGILAESVEILKQFRDFSLFSDLHGVIQRLEDKIHVEKEHQKPIIHLDKNENLKGLEYLDVIYQAILKEICLTIEYQSFRSYNKSEIVLHPFILKEYNNRWFVIGKREGAEQLLTLALDRIEKLTYALATTYDDNDFDADDYYKNTIGVTVLNDEHMHEVELQVNRHNSPYVLTKPFHSSQKVIDKLEDGSTIISLKVHLNFEFERLILGFGEGIKVLQPRTLRRRIKSKLKHALAQYQ